MASLLPNSLLARSRMPSDGENKRAAARFCGGRTLACVGFTPMKHARKRVFQHNADHTV
jgi:hypothetical protein